MNWRCSRCDYSFLDANGEDINDHWTTVHSTLDYGTVEWALNAATYGWTRDNGREVHIGRLVEELRIALSGEPHGFVSHDLDAEELSPAAPWNQAGMS